LRRLARRGETTWRTSVAAMAIRSFDILAEVVCESDDDLVELLNSRIRPLPGVISSETFVYLGLRKQSYDWGTR
jgi:Lrp/AsnC family transcriptional regulator for asnA, asnC and gidA